MIHYVYRRYVHLQETRLKRQTGCTTARCASMMFAGILKNSSLTARVIPWNGTTPLLLFRRCAVISWLSFLLRSGRLCMFTLKRLLSFRVELVVVAYSLFDTWSSISQPSETWRRCRGEAKLVGFETGPKTETDDLVALLCIQGLSDSSFKPRGSSSTTFSTSSARLLTFNWIHNRFCPHFKRVVFAAIYNHNIEMNWAVF